VTPKIAREIRLPDVFRCLLGRDSETKLWVAHCLDFDLATSGKTEDEAWKRLLRVVKMHVEHCFTHHPDGLKHKAEQDQWDLFERLKQEKRELIRSEKISLTLIPQPEDVADFFWIQGVDAASADSIPTVH
jgi:hypothetical protein